MLKGKDAEGVLKALEGCFDQVYTVAPDTPRAVSADLLAAAASEHFRRVEACGSLAQALAKAAGAGRGAFASAARSIWRERRGGCSAGRENSPPASTACDRMFR